MTKNEIRERLVELIGDAPVWKHGSWDEAVLFVANHLIANGVTVQEWIPVSEGVPEDSRSVILCTRSRIVGVGFYDKTTRNWVQHYSGGGICVDVTHWMPLPQSPKED